MESAQQIKKDERQLALEAWLADVCHLSSFIVQPMTGDASFRRYFRVQDLSGSFVAMDAPPPRENCAPFVTIARGLRSRGLLAPEILAADIAQGFLLLTNFGDATYLKTLTNHNADELYRSALDALLIFQDCKDIPNHDMPFFDANFMQQEWAWHKEWFLTKFLKLSFVAIEPALDEAYAKIVASAVEQPQVCMYRDFHSANLMVLPHGQVGLLDFQDAFIGPVTYDIASLLRDCYIDWPQEKVQQWALYYYEKLQMLGVVKADAETFLRWFDYMSLQRHLKALLTFARKYVRDHQPEYLQHIPRTLNYIQQVSSQYPELKALHDFYRVTVPAKLAEVMSCVR